MGNGEFTCTEKDFLKRTPIEQTLGPSTNKWYLMKHIKPFIWQRIT